MISRAKTLTRRVRRQLEVRLFNEEWFIATRPRRPGSFPDSMEGFRVSPAPRGYFYADPFLLEWSGRHFVFFEEYSRRREKGRILYSELGPDGGLSAPEVALEREFHLSYPFVFEHDGAVYMIPETAHGRRIEIYRAPEFPGSFEFERVLLDDVSAVDATLIFHQERFWLMMSVFDPDGVAALGAGKTKSASDVASNADPPSCQANPSTEPGVWASSMTARVCSTLHAYWSETLEGPWKAHSANPVVNDLGCARPGGRLFHDGERLIRPGQNCSRRYGEEVVFSHVEQLTPDVFSERELGRIPSLWLPGNLGTHTYNRDSCFEVVDGRWLTSTRRWLDLTFRVLSCAVDGPHVSSIRPGSAWCLESGFARIDRRRLSRFVAPGDSTVCDASRLARLRRSTFGRV